MANRDHLCFKLQSKSFIYLSVGSTSKTRRAKRAPKRRVVQKWNANYSSSPVIGSAVDVAALNQTKTTDYVENLMYENGVLKRIQVEGGYYDMSAGKYYYSD